MDEDDWLGERFEEQRGHLRGVAYRMLGSLSEAEDAVQEAWLRLRRSDTSGVDNLAGWLTTVVSRVCLDMLRSRKARREEPIEPGGVEPVAPARQNNPEQEVLLADSVGVALLVVLDTLEPAERLAFVLHDMFAVPFDEIATIVGRSPAAARQLASRARRRVQGAPRVSRGDLDSQRSLVSAFLTALRGGDVQGLLAVLDPDLVVRADAVIGRGAAREVRGAETWAKGAAAFGHLARSAQPAMVDGAVGLVLARGGRFFRALRFAFANGRITEIEVIGDPDRLRELDLAVLG